MNTLSHRPLLDSDGQNSAVRELLAIHQGNPAQSVSDIRTKMDVLGWTSFLPDFIVTANQNIAVTQLDLQKWIRHFFALESAGMAPAKDQQVGGTRLVGVHGQRSISDSLLEYLRVTQSQPLSFDLEKRICAFFRNADSKQIQEFLDQAIRTPDDDFEIRGDGMRVRKDRWKVGIQNISTALSGPSSGFEIDEVVSMVKVLVRHSCAGFEYGGDGTVNSATKKDCPSCSGRGETTGEQLRGSIMIPIDIECENCEGKGKVSV